MTNTELFIQLAIEGGWICGERRGIEEPIENDDYIFYSEILDPKAWQAVGKVEGWKQGVMIGGVRQIKGSGWWDKMHDLIDALARGETIEDYLGSILNHD